MVEIEKKKHDEDTYIVTRKMLQLCDECQKSNNMIDDLSYSIMVHKELIWKKLKKTKVLYLSTVYKNKNITELLVKRLEEDGLITNGARIEGPIETLWNKEGEEIKINVYRYKIRIAAGMA